MKKLLFFSILFIVAACSKEYFAVKEVVITFDDAPGFPENTSLILDILKKYDVKATFFCVGMELNNHMELAERISTEQFMANHTYSHINLKTVNISEVYESEILKTQKIIDSLQEGNPHFFRPPYGELSTEEKRFLRSKGYEVIMWDLSAEEWNDKVSTQEVVNYFNENLTTKTQIPILLFHLNKSTVEALDTILADFAERSIKVISLQELKER